MMDDGWLVVWGWQSRHRQAYGATLTNSPAAHMVYHKYAKMASDEELGGNISTPQSKDVIRKLKSEQMSDANIHTNVFQEINILRHVLSDTHSGGIVQKYSLKPLQIHTYCTDQLDLYLEVSGTQEYCTWMQPAHCWQNYQGVIRYIYILWLCRIQSSPICQFMWQKCYQMINI